MTFSTKEFALKTSDYISIKFGLIFQKSWMIWLALIVGGKIIQFFHLPYAVITGGILILLGVLWPCLAAVAVYFDALSPLNASHFFPRTITFNEEGFVIHVREGNSSFIRWTSIVSRQKWTSLYLLFTTKDQCIAVPIDAFHRRLDRMDFEYLLSKHKYGMPAVRIKKSSPKK